MNKQNAIDMKPLTVKISEEVRELSFVISPPPHIMSDVSVLKDDVQFLVGHELEDRYTKANILLFKFDDKKLFDEIIRFVESKAVDFEPFNIFIKNLNFFHLGPNRTVYLDIVNKYLIQDIFEKVVKEDMNYTPHISIARNLQPEDFLKTWLYLKDFHYSQHFLCDRITVLARAGKRWAHYRDIMFSSSL